MEEIIEKFRNELALRGRSISTRQTYGDCLSVILKQIGERPSLDQVKKFLLTIKGNSYHRQMVGTVHRYFEYVLKSPIDLSDIPYPKKEDRIPEVFSVEEMRALIDVPKNIKHQLIIYFFYGCGLRMGELLRLKIQDVNPSRKTIFIRLSKGSVRQVGIDGITLGLLDQYLKSYKPQDYLFQGQHGGAYTSSSVNQLLKYYAKKAGIPGKIHAHKLRHSYATHLHESGVDLRLIGRAMGHKNHKATDIYTRTSRAHFIGMKTPIELLKGGSV